MNIFEQAARKKLRVSTPIGLLAVEDLFDLPLVSSRQGEVSIDSIGSELTRQQEVTGFVTKGDPNPSRELTLKILRHIADTRQQEVQVKLEISAAEAAKEAERKAIEDALAYRVRSDLSQLSEEELRQRLASLA